MKLLAVCAVLIPIVCLAQSQSDGASKPGVGPAGGSWLRIVRVDKMDDKIQMAYRLAIHQDHRSPSITYLCNSGNLLGGIYDAAVMLTLDHVIGEQNLSSVGYRKDHSIPGEGWWNRTDDGQSLVIPKEQLRKMIDGQTLLIQATKFEGGVIEDEFPTGGLDQAMFAKDCGQ